MDDAETRPSGNAPAPQESPATRDSTDWEIQEYRRALRLASDWVVRYRERIEEFPVFPAVRPGDVRRRLPEAPPADPEPLEQVLADLDRDVLPGLTHWNHPGFFAYFSSAARGPSVVAELLIAALGANAMLWRTSPAATELEETVVDWLRQAVGLPGAFAGQILDTASTSSFTALLAARERAGDRVRETGLAGDGKPLLTVYVSEHAHASLEKAAMAAGLGREAVRHIPSDGAFRMRPDALAAALESDRASGLRPAMIGATLGTTSTASVDPVGAIADLASRFGVWLHVDAAYGGAAALLPEERGPFEGWEQADSIVINPHKWLGTSLDCSVLLFRDPEPFRRALALDPAYLHGDHDDVTNLMDLALPQGRRFRALKLWLLFRCAGTEGLRGTLRDHIGWAREFAARIERDERFELAAPPSFATVCFRAVGPAGQDRDVQNRLNRTVLGRVNAGGRAFLSHTELDGRYTLRLSIGSVHTRWHHVEAALEALRRAAEAGLGDLER